MFRPLEVPNELAQLLEKRENNGRRLSDEPADDDATSASSVADSSQAGVEEKTAADALPTGIERRHLNDRRTS